MTPNRGFRIGTVRGIPIKVEWTLVGIFVLMTWSLATSGVPAVADGYRTFEYWIAAAVTTALVLMSLLAHELSHSLVARRYGIEVHDITLWLLGGVSRIEQEPATPTEDLHIALAGPGTSFAIAAGAVLATGALDAFGAPSIVVATMVLLASVNLVLGVFNMVPAAPLDGGRVLRAYLWRKRGDQASAAISATRAGRVFAYVLIGLGFVELAGGIATGLWLVLLGAFLSFASRAEETQVRMERDLKDTRLRDVMSRDPITVNAAASVDEVLHDFVLGRHCSSFPVVGADGTVAGLVTLRQLRSVMPAARSVTAVGTIAVPIEHVRTGNPGTRLLAALAKHDADDDGRILVFDSGELVGIVSPTDVTRALQFAEQFGPSQAAGVRSSSSSSGAGRPSR